MGADLSPDDGRRRSTHADHPEPWFPTFVGKTVESARAQAAGAYLDVRGRRVLAELDAIAAARRTSVAAVTLAWLRAQPNVVAPIASARTPEQLAEILPMATLELTRDEVARLTAASSTSAATAG